MDRIVIEVGDDLARKWRNTNPQTKQLISQELDQFLATIFDKKEDDIWPFLEKLRIEAETKGFDDHVLAEILNEK